MSKKFLAVLLVVCMVVSAAPMAFAVEFTDTDDHWAESSIARWAEYKIVEGYDGAFDPEGNMTRGQAAAVFARLLKLETKADISKYTDVDPNEWYAEYIALCVAAGIMNGVGDDAMDPNGTLSREQMMTMLCRALGIEPEETCEKEFTDSAEISDWAEGYMNALVNAGIVNGISEDSLAPTLDINRASVMALLDKGIAAYADEEGETVSVDEGATGVVLIVANDVTVEDAPVGTIVVTGADASGATVNGTEIDKDTVHEVPEVKEEEPVTPPAPPVIPDIPVHYHSYTYVTNNNGTHQKICCGTVTEPCDGDPCSKCGYDAPAPTVAVTGVALDKETLYMPIGGTGTLSATVAPDNASDKTVTWLSSNGDVATVVDGTVTAVAAGTATITATTVDGSFTDTCAVTVVSPTYTYAYDAQRSPEFPYAPGGTITAKSFKTPLNANRDKYASSEGLWALVEVGTYGEQTAASTDLTGIVNGIATTWHLDSTGKNALKIYELIDKDCAHVAYGVIVATDETNGYVMFIGDTWDWYSGGASYVLSNSAITADSVTLGTAYEAKIGSTYYATLKAAVDAAGENTIVLQKDVTLANPLVAVGEIIDLNGKTITGDVVATVKMNGGKFVTSKYPMVAPTGTAGGYAYFSSNGVFTMPQNELNPLKVDLTFVSGDVVLAKSWQTDTYHNVTISSAASFTVPADMSFLIQTGTNVVVEDAEKIIVNGTIVMQADTTLKAPESLNVVGADETVLVTYADGTHTAVAAEAKIGDTYYATFADAVTSGVAGDIVLVKDVTVPTDSIYTASMGKTVDLNGHTLTKTILGTIKANGGTYITTEGAKQIVPEDCEDAVFVSDNLVFTITADGAGNQFLTMSAGEVTLGDHCADEGGWYTLEKQTLTLEEGAEFIIPNNMFFYIKGTSRAVINGTLTLVGNSEVQLADGATLEAPAGLNVVGANGNIAVVYADGTYSTVAAEAKIGTVGYATLADAIAAANNGDTITLLSDITAPETIVINKDIIFDGNGKTISGTVNLNSDTGIAVIDTTGCTIKDLTISGGRWGIRVPDYAMTHNLTLEGVTIVESVRPVVINKTNDTKENLKVFTATECTFAGKMAYADFAVSEASFDRCEFQVKGGKKGNLIEFYADTTFTNCEFEVGYVLDFVSQSAREFEVVLSGCTGITDGTYTNGNPNITAEIPL